MPKLLLLTHCLGMSSESFLIGNTLSRQIKSVEGLILDWTMVENSDTLDAICSRVVHPIA